jgi:hypothetical protein
VTTAPAPPGILTPMVSFVVRIAEAPAVIVAGLSR